ncbi:MAG: hypothetical protein GEU94_04715 [Micromonosporaceae bacterium]|nr:hypothetical protein [Micromonosporaceae bacterium]
MLPAAAESELPVTTVSRHAPVLRRNVPDRDPVLIVARCVRAERPWQGEFILMITRERLVITQETRMLSRIRPHLDAPIGSLANVAWSADPRRSAMELAFTIDTGRHRFIIQAPHRHQVWRLDAMFGRIFQQPLQLAF